MNRVVSYIPVVFIVMAPFGAAAHNIYCALLLVIGSVHLVQSTAARSLLISGLRHAHVRFFAVSLVVFLAAMSASAVINAQTTAYKIIEYILGYLPLVLLPLYALLVPQMLQPTQLSRLKTTFTATIVIVGLLCLSQLLFGWQRSGLGVVASEHRARGMYSHPLTLAYVTILLWPMCCYAFIRDYRNAQNVLSLAASATITFAAKSRITQILSALAMLSTIICHLRRKTKIIGLTLFALTMVLLITVPNPVRKNFVETFAGQADRHTDAYPDDRLAFWDAHWHLLKQAPIIGQGPHYPKQILLNAYDAIGLGGFPKKYTAHNTYLEIAVTGGIIGLLCFLTWVWSIWRLIQQNAKTSTLYHVGRQTLAIFCLAILTQNAFQDTEVRFVLAGLLAILVHTRIHPNKLEKTLSS